jgi:Flp pilus assembly protein CpaB
MLPSLTAAVVRRRPPRRALLGAGGALLLAISLVGSLRAPATTAVAAAPTLADALRPNTWAMSVPTSWFIAPISGLRPGDRVDVLALRPGDRATAQAVAFDLLVVAVEDRAIVVGTGADDATALSVARASGLLLVPLLRSSK